MATRSLTEVFILMRNNALQNRHNEADDRQALVGGRDRDMEMGLTNKLPPEWVDSVEEIQFEISRIKPKIKELLALHDKHVNRPTLDDNVEEEHTIEIQTQEITQMFRRCQRIVQQINAKSRVGSEKEKHLSKNITSSLARTLQDLSSQFRNGQSTYLRKLKAREERSQFFNVDLTGNDLYDVDSNDIDPLDRGFTADQAQVVANNTSMVAEREKEILQIVQSIQDLNDIFKDLAQLIVDQGTILDRIDYNIEQTSVSVEKGLGQLQKASKHQKKNRKMHVILVLFVIVLILIILLIATKGRR